VDNELDWSLVYPELGMVKRSSESKSGILQIRKECYPKKLDAMLKDAKIDGELMSSLEIVSKILNQLQKYCSNC
jgi:hypothetical protein